MSARFSLFFIIIFLLIPVQISHSATFVSGEWVGKSHNDKNGKFANCYMKATYKSGVTLMFMITRDFNWGISLINRKWKLRKGAKINVSLTVDDFEPMVAVSKVSSKDAITIPLSKVKGSVGLIRRGHVLEIKTRKGSVSFNLTGTHAGISRLSKCVARQLRAENHLKGTNPFSGLESSPSSKVSNTKKYGRIDRSAATVFITNLLSESGVTGFKILTLKQHPLKDQDVMWLQPGGVVGSFVMIKNAKRVNIDDIVARTIGNDSKGCTDNFASGKKTSAAPQKGTSVRRVFSVCQGGGNSFENHYTLIKNQNGTLIRVLHATDGKSGADVLEKSDDAFLKHADWKVLQ